MKLLKVEMSVRKDDRIAQDLCLKSRFFLQFPILDDLQNIIRLSATTHTMLKIKMITNEFVNLRQCFEPHCCTKQYKGLQKCSKIIKIHVTLM